MIKTTLQQLSIPLVRQSARKDLKLMVHQNEMMNAEESLLLLVAPTSSGKTLANLLRIEKAATDAIMIYPTKELINDQACSLRNLIQDKLQKEARILDAGSLDSLTNHTDYAVIVATGDSLEEEGMPKGNVLMKLLNIPSNRRILLTNLDLLYLVMKSYYYNAEHILRILSNFNILVIDEFHLYSGIFFANLVFTLWPMKFFNQIILSSATPSSTIELFKKLYPKSRLIEPRYNLSNDVRIVRHKTELTVKPIEQILGGEEDVKRVADDVRQLYSKYKASDADVKVLVIVNSLAFCIKLGAFLKEEYGKDSVAEIHGLVPSKLRSRKDITVCTSAAEVGVDFDIASLVFEAWDSSAFMQRLGRGGRHRPCEAIAYVPPELVDSNFLPEFTYFQLRELVRLKLDSLKTYDEFLRSEQATELFTGFMLGAVRIKMNQELIDSIKELRKLLQNNQTIKNWSVPFIDTNKVEVHLRRSPNIRFLHKSGARGGIAGLTVLYKDIFDDGPILDQVSISEIGLMHFNGEPISSGRVHEEYGIKLKSWMNKKILIVNDFLDERRKISCASDANYLRRPKPIKSSMAEHTDTNFSIQTGDASVDDIVNDVLDGTIGYFTKAKVDWRFQRIKDLVNNGTVVLGSEALIQHYLDSLH